MTTYGSVCSGIEAATVAMEPLGWKAAWYAEIEPFPSSVLAHHYPDVPNLGDMTLIAAAVRAGDVAAPDALIGGTPCQAFSVAGLRNSLADERGNLTLRYVELADAIDDVRRRAGQPEAVIWWENVPGVLSTKDNAFGCFLAGLAGEDEPLQPAGKKWSNAGCVYGPARAVAWRTLDAQYLGLAQRRRRVFVVASARDGFDPATVLFEWDGVRRDTPPRREAGQGAAAGTGGGPDGGSIAGAVTRKWSKGSGTPLVPQVAATLDASFGRLQGVSGQDANHGHSHLVAAVAFMADDYRTGSFEETDLARPLTTSADRSRAAPVAVSTTAVAFAENSRAELRLEGGDGLRCGTLSTGGGKPGQGVPMVAFQSSQSGLRVDDVPATLDSNNGSRRHNGVFGAMAVRRLTPRECERLQGFPDDYTLVPATTVMHRKTCVSHGTKEVVSHGIERAECGCRATHKTADQCPDGPRYKSLGNSMAVTCMRWIGTRIDQALRRLA